MLLSFAFVLLLLRAQTLQGCRVLYLSSAEQGFIDDEYVLSHYTIPGNEAEGIEDEHIFSHNGRPIYVSVSDPPRYLFHMQVGDDLGGRWLVGGEVGQNSAWAFVQSFATSPHLVPVVSERATWRVFAPPVEGEESLGGAWSEDPQLSIQCSDDLVDSTVFLSSAVSPSLTGMYSETAELAEERPVYVHARGDLYLYASGTASDGIMWIVGEQPGENNGLAFIDDMDVEDPSFIPEAAAIAAAEGRDLIWNVAMEGGWVEDPSLTILSANTQGCTDTLVQQRGLEDLNNGNDSAEEAPTSLYLENLEQIHHICNQESTWEIVKMSRMAWKPIENVCTLPNGVNIPLVGFGTGATHRDDVYAGVSAALNVGYRMLDTATAYDNEDLIGAAFHDEEIGVDRAELFVLSKLWFSELGMDETLAAAQRSLANLKTDYLDAYLIHWPRCYEDTWMDCSTASNGTWQQSWRALERLYAEGLVLSIGVSNFDANLMYDLLDMASTSPHITQNHRELLNQDGDVLDICQAHGIFYQSYSSLRSIISPEPEASYRHAKSVVDGIAKKHKKTAAQVILRWLAQGSCGSIPRSHSLAHLKENLDVFDFELSEREMAALDALDDGSEESLTEEL